jgi:vacuolar-type H+-ATPase subunit E/Vma4
MEELRSTDILDKEILEDARKKAQRTLSAADDTIKSMDALWDKKIAKALSRARKKFDEQLAHNRTEIMARLPLDKRRVRSEKIEGLLISAASSYFTGLARDKQLALLESELKDRLQELVSNEALCGPLMVYSRELDEDELNRILAKAVPRNGRQETWVLQKGDALFTLPGSFPAIVIDTETARVTASIDGVMENLLQDKRAELVSALLGPAALDAADALPEEGRDA